MIQPTLPIMTDRQQANMDLHKTLKGPSGEMTPGVPYYYREPITGPPKFYSKKKITKMIGNDPKLYQRLMALRRKAKKGNIGAGMKLQKKYKKAKRVYRKNKKAAKKSMKGGAVFPSYGGPYTGKVHYDPNNIPSVRDNAMPWTTGGYMKSTGKPIDGGLLTARGGLIVARGGEVTGGFAGLAALASSLVTPILTQGIGKIVGSLLGSGLNEEKVSQYIQDRQFPMTGGLWKTVFGIVREIAREAKLTPAQYDRVDKYLRKSKRTLFGKRRLIEKPMTGRPAFDMLAPIMKSLKVGDDDIEIVLNRDEFNGPDGGSLISIAKKILSSPIVKTLGKNLLGAVTSTLKNPEVQDAAKSAGKNVISTMGNRVNKYLEGQGILMDTQYKKAPPPKILDSGEKELPMALPINPAGLPSPVTGQGTKKKVFDMIQGNGYVLGTPSGTTTDMYRHANKKATAVYGIAKKTPSS